MNRLVTLALVAALLAPGCKQEQSAPVGQSAPQPVPQPGSQSVAESGPQPVRVESDLPEATVDTILRVIAANGGPQAELVSGKKADAALLAPSAKAPSGDELRWDAEPYGALAAAAAGTLAPMPQSAQGVPSLWRDPGGTWVAIGGRAEVLLINTDELGDHGAPVRFTALTEPWLKGRVALAAPTDGPALAHFAALYRAWNPERMEIWLGGLKANAAQVLDSGDDVRKAVVSGRAIVGILTSDQAAMAAASAAHVLVVYPNQRSIGTFVWPTALSLSKNASERARRLAERLADKSTEQLLVARVPGYLPLRGDIPTPPGVRSAANLVVISVGPSAIVSEIALRKERLAAWTAEMRKLARTAAK